MSHICISYDGPRGSERENSDSDALRCNSAILRGRPLARSNDPLNLSLLPSPPPPSMCIFPEKQELEENQGSRQSCNRVDIKIETRADRIRRRYNVSKYR